MKNSDLQAVVRVIQEGESFLIAGHVSPDGDCLGSMCALAFALSDIGKKAFPVCLEGVPDLYRFIPGSERILNQLPKDFTKCDVAIAVDSDRPDRLGPISESLSSCERLIAIDHHLDGCWESGTNLIDPLSASSGEIVYELLKGMGVRITRDIAECLMTAIVSDTGTFRFTNVKPSTMRIAADLMETGVSPGKIASQIYEVRTLSSTKLLGEALRNLSTSLDGRIAYTYITKEQIQKAGSKDSETDGIVNFVRSVRGAKVGIFFRTAPEGDTRVSLRGPAEDGDISEVARMFGGGGHRAAAGCTVEKPLSEAMPIVLDAVKRWMES
jgi:bifunctional oligoribonuclease and PAP phosphatase NrnA